MKKKARSPSIPTLGPNVPADIRRAINAIKEWIDLRGGRTTDKLEEVVTKRDLIDGKFATLGGGQLRPISGGTGGNGGIEERDDRPWTRDEVDEFFATMHHIKDMPRPTGIILTSTYGDVFVRWDSLSREYDDDFAEIYRGPEDGTVTGAEYVGQSTTNVFKDDNVERRVTYRYWVRFVNREGVPGPWHKDAGDTIYVAPRIAEIMDEISGELRDSDLHIDFQDRLNGFDQSFADVDTAFDDLRLTDIADLKIGYNNITTLTNIENTNIYNHYEAMKSHKGIIETVLDIREGMDGSFKARRLDNIEGDVEGAEGRITKIEDLNITKNYVHIDTIDDIEGSIGDAEARAMRFASINLGNLITSGGDWTGWTSTTISTWSGLPDPRPSEKVVQLHYNGDSAYSNTFPVATGKTLYISFLHTVSGYGRFNVYIEFRRSDGATSTMYVGSTTSNNLSEWQLFRDSAFIPSVYADYPEARLKFVSGSSSDHYMAEVTANYSGALVESGNRLYAKVGDQEAKIDQKASVVDVNGAPQSEYAVVMDNNGNIAGFGLSNNASTSQFRVRADKFYIDNGSGRGSYPFMVVGNNTYIKKAFIQDASIDNGKLGPIKFGEKLVDEDGHYIVVDGKISADYIDAAGLEVSGDAIIGGTISGDGWSISPSGDAIFGTLQLRHNSITVSEYAKTTRVLVYESRNSNFGSVTAYTASDGGGSGCIITANFVARGVGGDTDGHCRLRRGTTQIASMGTAVYMYYQTYNFTFYDPTPGSDPTYTFNWETRDQGGGSHAVEIVASGALIVSGGKR